MIHQFYQQLIKSDLKYIKEVIVIKILLVDDEIELVNSLKAILQKENFSVDGVSDPRDVKYYLESSSYDLIILDIMMPYLDGYTLLKSIRDKKINTPVIFLSAKSDIEDKLKGLDLGGDDYLTKPFSTKELIARIKAIVRRNNQKADNILSFHDLVLSLSSYKLIYKEKEISLVNKEFQIMELFMLNPNFIYSSEDILKKVWSYDSYSDTTTVWTFLSSLRKKLAFLTDKIKIKSNRGVGYSLIYED